MATHFVIHPNYSAQKEALQQLLSHFDSTGEYVVREGRNVIKKVNLDDVTYNIKKFRNPNALQRYVYQYLRKGKAKRSYEYAELLLEKGIKTPHPVAYQEQFDGGLQESYYISEHIEYDFDFRVLNHNPKWPNRNEILRQMAAFTFKLHEQGIQFLDHSPGNTLIKDNHDGTYDFYLIDLNRMKFGTMDFNVRMRNFRRLWLSKTMINVMAPVYAKLYG